MKKVLLSRGFFCYRIHAASQSRDEKAGSQLLAAHFFVLGAQWEVHNMGKKSQDLTEERAASPRALARG